MPAVDKPHYQDGDFLVDYEEKVFEDVQAEPGAKALVTCHTVAFEGSIGLVNMLQAMPPITTSLAAMAGEISICAYLPSRVCSSMAACLMPIMAP